MVSAYSIGTAKRHSEHKNQNPGPSDYIPKKKQRIQPPEWSIGTAKRVWRSNSEGPGPGAYESPPKMTQEGAKYSIALKTSIVQPNSNAPGPGAYSNKYDQVFPAPPQFSMAQKTESGFNQSTEKQPGPGSYETQNQLSKTMIRFPMSSRTRIQVREVVQSAIIKDYDIQKSENAISNGFGPKWVIGTSKREDTQFTEKRKYPGPGAYQLQQLLQNNKGISIGLKTSENTDRTINPGPGAYDDLRGLKQSKKTGPAYRIGTAPRETFKGSASMDRIAMPGPGSYDQNYGQLNSSARGGSQVKIGTSIRKSLHEFEKTPGPGSYDVDGQKRGKNIVITGGRSEQHDQIQQPGPSTYQPNFSYVKDRPATSKIGTSMRQPLHQGVISNTIGPGYYDIRGKFQGPHWVFNRSPRSQHIQTSRIPGPGQYTLPPAFADVPKYLLNNSVVMKN